MKLKIVSILASFLILLNLMVCGTAQAHTLAQVSPDKPDFTTLIPGEKTDFFAKIKNMFKPSSDEIAEKIKTGMNMKEKFKPALDDASTAIEGAKPKLTPDEIVEKINAKAAAVE